MTKPPANSLAPWLSGRWALVTGGAHRLGRAVATRLAERGANVVIHYRGSADAAAETAQALGALGVQARTVAGDLSRPDDVADLMRRARDRAGPIDVLVNNASIFRADGVAEVTRQGLEEILQVNAWAPLLLSRDLAAQGRDGAVVNLLDTRITAYDPTHFSYGLSKQLLHRLTTQLALELAPRIRVNGVAPGLVLPPPGQDRAYLERRAGSVPLERAGDAPDVVRAVDFLLTSPFVTGQVIFVDGGAHLLGGVFSTKEAP